MNKSGRLKEIIKIRGWTREDLISGLERRRLFLEKVIEENKTRYSDFSKEIGKFYLGERRAI